MVQFCGKCRRQYPKGTGSKCPGCGSNLVTWNYEGGESESEANWRWKRANGQMLK